MNPAPKPVDLALASAVAKVGRDFPSVGVVLLARAVSS